MSASSYTREHGAAAASHTGVGGCVATPLAIAASLPLYFLASRRLRKLLLAIVVLDVPLQIGTHLYYDELSASVGALGGLEISVTSMALAVLYLSWFVERTLDKASGACPRIVVSRPFLTYVMIAAASVVVASNAALTFYEVALFVQMFLLYVYLASNLRSPEEVLAVLMLLMIGLVIESALIVMMGTQSLNFEGLRLLGVKSSVESAGGFSRPGGTIGGSNGAAAYLGMILPCALGVSLMPVSRRQKVVALVGFALGVVALVMTFSRGGYIGFAVAMVLFLLAAGRRRGAGKKVVVVGVVVLAAGLVLFGNKISERFSSDDNGSAESRISLMKMARHIIEDHPLLGVGANNYSEVIEEYATSDFRGGQWIFAVHNHYLLVWAETGAVGLTAFLWFLGAVLRQGWRCWKRGHALFSPLALGVVAGLASYMVHMSVDLFRGRPLLELMCVLAALVAAISRLRSEDRWSQAA